MRKSWIILVGLTLAGCASVTHTPATPTSVNGTVIPVEMLNPAVTQATIHQTICVKGWTAKVRPPNLPTKKGYQDDHIISLELGGAPSAKVNLRFVPLPRAKVDDQLENRLHAQVCVGKLTLVQGQQQELYAKRDEGPSL